MIDLSKTRCKYDNGKVYYGGDVVMSKVKSWHVLQPLKIALNNSEFIPVIETELYKKAAFRSNKIKNIFIITYCFVFFICFGVFFLYSSNIKAFNLMLISGVVTLYFLFDYLISMRTIALLSEKSKFIHEAFRVKKKALFYLSIMLLFGAFQLILTFYYSDADVPIVKFGGYYSSIQKGEYWRFITAPMFHSGIFHWLTNTVILILIVPYFNTTTSSRGIGIFFLGAIFGAVIAYIKFLFGDSSSDGFVGISAGIYSLLGFLIIKLYLKNNHPKTWFYFILNFILLNILSSIILLPSISTYSHMAGFIVGSLLATVHREKDVRDN